MLADGYLAESAQDHEETAKEQVCANVGSTAATSAAPAHQDTRER